VASPEPGTARALLLDVEGTTTPVDFVYQVLFPYAREHVASFLERQWNEDALRADVARLHEEHAADERGGECPPAWTSGSQQSVVSYVHWLMDRDRKSTGLKSLQGRIWEDGYRGGALRAQVYPDVPRAFARWRRQGREIAIFSSGSVLAQRLLFAHSTEGDLTPFIRGYFDTSSGAKKDAESYRRIASALGFEPSAVLFVSDVAAELDAAREAGLATALCARNGAPTPPPAHHAVNAHRVLGGFDEVYP
jgi:enolase-phosphatase E1